MCDRLRISICGVLMYALAGAALAAWPVRLAGQDLDDMEAYKSWIDPSGPWIFVVWRDGGICDPHNGNNTGSVLSENADMTYVLGGSQSMRFDYDNDGMVPIPCEQLMYSKIEAQTADLPSGVGSDWTVEGVKALQINFMGQLGNSTTDPLWVQLQDSSKTYGTKVFYGEYPGEDINDINDPEWHEWFIDLAEFAVDLNDVVSIVIGIGNEDANTPGGSGTLYFDEIRLHAPKCIPQRRTPAFALLDYAPEAEPDCVIDCKELAIMARDWLQAPEPITSPANITDAESQTPTINLKDYAELTKNYLKTQSWPF